MSPYDAPLCPETTSALDRYAHLKADLLACLSELAGHWPTGQSACHRLASKLDQERFNLVVVGQFKRGKTSLINALLGESLLPVGALPLTSVSTELRHGPTLTIEVRFRDGRRLTISREQLADYATEAGNPHNHQGVRDIQIAHPAPFLSYGLRLLDTPGIGSLHDHNTETARAMLPRCDAVLFLLSADQPAGRAELDFLAEVRDHAQRIFCVLNKIDILAADELEPVVAFTRTALGGEWPVFPVSARQALRSGGWADPGLRQQSRLPALVHALQQFISQDKGRILLLGAARDSLRLLQQCRLELDIERQGWAVPPEVLETRLRRFQERRAELDGAHRHVELDYRDRVQRLATTALDPELRRWRRLLETRLGQDLERQLREWAGLAPQPLDNALATFIAERVDAACLTCAAEVGERLARELATVGRTFAEQVEAQIVALRDFAADLCALERPALASGPAWTPPPLVLENETEPSGLEWLAAVLTVHAAPDWLEQRFPALGAVLARWAKRRIAHRRRRDLQDAIDLGSGRVRYGLLLGLEREQVRYRTALLDQQAAAAEGIEAALRAGLSASRLAAETLVERREALARLDARLEALAGQVEAIRHAARTL